MLRELRMHSSRLPHFVSIQLGTQLLQECQHLCITHSYKRAENSGSIGKGRSRKQVAELAECIELAIDVVRGGYEVDCRFCCDRHVAIEDQER